MNEKARTGGSKVEEKVYCRCEGEHGQRHLEGSRQFTAGRLKLALGVRGVGNKRGERGIGEERGGLRPGRNLEMKRVSRSIKKPKG